MKKLILASIIVFTVALTMTSCKKETKATKTSSTAISTEVYQCPMDCEKGKSYTKAGACPVCKMDLKAKKAGETKKAIETKAVEIKEAVEATGKEVKEAVEATGKEVKEAVEATGKEVKKAVEDHTGHNH